MSGMNHPSQLESVYLSRNRRECRHRSLVLNAAGVNHHVHHRAGEFALLVAPEDSARARAELAAYASENPASLPSPKRVPPMANGWIGVIGYTAVLIVLDYLQRTHHFGLNWYQLGETNAAKMKDGQWWRTVTALTLHADLPHLMGNLVIGGLFGLFVGQTLGSGLGWLAILVAGVAGNFLNAMIRQPGYTSIGASTAVFAALGILAGTTWTHRRRTSARTLARWTPLIGGAILLGYLGTGGERTDVGAHIFGFLVGLILGVTLDRAGSHLALSIRSQLVLGAVALAILVVAWSLAIGNA